MKKIITAALVCLSLLSFTACNQSAKGDKEYLLKMRLNKGDTFNYNMIMDMDMDLMSMKMKMETGSHFEVTDSTATGKELNVTYTKMNTKMSMGGNPMPGGADSMVNKSNKNFVGKTITITLAGNKVTDVKGFETLTANTTDTTTRAAMEKMFSKESINSMFGMMFNMYPGKPVKEGDSWTADNSIDMGGMKMGIKTKYTLLKVTGDIAELAVEGTLGSKGAMTQSGMNIEMDMTGTQKGKMNVKLSDGYLQTGKYDMAVDAQMNMMGQKMPLKMKMVCDITGN